MNTTTLCVVLLAGLIGCADGTSVIVCHTENPAEDLSKATETPLSEVNDLFNRDMTICRVGDFDVIVPAERKEGETPELWPELWVWREGKPVLSTQQGKGTIWHTPVSSVSSEDRNSDGAVDYLKYETKPKGVLKIVTMYDRNLDGELDTRTIFPGGEVWSLVEGEWYLRVRGTENRAVIVDGIPRRVGGIDGAFLFEDK